MRPSDSPPTHGPCIQDAPPRREAGASGVFIYRWVCGRTTNAKAGPVQERLTGSIAVFPGLLPVFTTCLGGIAGCLGGIAGCLGGIAGCLGGIAGCLGGEVTCLGGVAGRQGRNSL